MFLRRRWRCFWKSFLVAPQSLSKAPHHRLHFFFKKKKLNFLFYDSTFSLLLHSSFAPDYFFFVYKVEFFYLAWGQNLFNRRSSLRLSTHFLLKVWLSTLHFLFFFGNFGNFQQKN